MEKINEKGLNIAHLRTEIQEYINNISEMYQVPRDMVTLAVYVATAVSAGSRITTNDGIYTNKLSLWSIIVGISGAGKTEFTNKVFQPILKRNAKLVKEYEDALSDWNGKGKEPEAKDFRLHSITLEALVEKINLNPDGLLLYRGELSGWVGGFGKYSKDDAEYASWIEVWDGKTFPCHTKTGNKKVINAKDPVLSVIGGVQPHIMKKFAKADILGSGFLGRLLMVYPPLCYPEAAPTSEFNSELLDWWEAFLDVNYKTTAQLFFNDAAMAIYNDFCYNYVREKVLEIGEGTIDPYYVCMLEFYGKIKVYAEKWAGIAMLLSGKSGWIDSEIMTATIEDMKVFEQYAMKVYGFIFGKPLLEISTKGEIIRKLDSICGIKNRSALAEGLEMDPSLLSKYINGKR